MKLRLKSIAVVLILILSTGVSLIGCKGNEKPSENSLNIEKPIEHGDVYQEWMSYIKDDTLYRDIANVGTHNSGSVDTAIVVEDRQVKTDWLTCQSDGIYTQLSYGVRIFDFRINEQNETLYLTHGLARGLKFEDAIKDLKSFSDEHPSEIIFFTLIPYLQQDIDPARVKAITDLLNPVDTALPETYDLSTVTVKELRDSGKKFIIATDSSWAEITHNRHIGVDGTWRSEYNFGKLEENDKLFDNLYKVFNESDENARIRPSVFRGSGESFQKTTPLAYMQHDREDFLELCEYIKSNPTLAKKCAGFTFDHVTEDYVLAAKTLEFNYINGYVNEPELYLSRLKEKIN